VGDVFGPVYEQTCHFLCVWPLAQNVFKHLSPLFSASVSGQCGGKAVATKWHDVNRAFWLIAKKGDRQSIGIFAEEFEEVSSMVSASGANAAAVIFS
jgi:hypothetical protein